MDCIRCFPPTPSIRCINTWGASVSCAVYLLLADVNDYAILIWNRFLSKGLYSMHGIKSPVFWSEKGAWVKDTCHATPSKNLWTYSPRISAFFNFSRLVRHAAYRKLQRSCTNSLGGRKTLCVKVGGGAYRKIWMQPLKKTNLGVAWA